MEGNYCVFWFPSVYHTSINKRHQRFEVEKSISDFGSDVVKLTVSINYSYDEKSLEDALKKARQDKSIIKNNLHFEVYKTNNGKKEAIFTNFDLIYKDHSNNGMVVYYYQKPSNYPKADNIPPFERALQTIFYHCAKLLFHDHEVQMDRDSGLVAYIAGPAFDPKNIRKPDNNAIKFFFSQYETIFMDYAETVSERIRRRDAIVTKFEGETLISDNMSGFSGYKALTQFGRREFISWYNDKNNSSEVLRCKKDMLSSWLVISPHYTMRKRSRDYYLDRIIRIGNIVKSRLKKNAKDEIIKENRIVEKLKEITDIFKEWGDTPWRKITKNQIFSVTNIIRICEIELGLINIKRGRLYRKLMKCHLDLPLLTEETRKQISKLCEGALTEYVYCKTLLESKYNTHVTHSKKETIEDELDRWRKKACNIRNAIRYIETVKYRCLNAQSNSINLTLKKADRLSQNAKVWTAIGIALSVIGLALTAVGIVLSTQGCGCC